MSYVKIPLGQGELRVAWTDRSVVLIDSQTNTQIRIFYNPYVRRWYAMLTDPQGNFVHSLRYISACATAVYEYCARSWETGNLYLDVLYCEPLWIIDLEYWRPADYILMAYRMGNRRPYYQWLRRILPEVARDIASRLRELIESAEATVVDVFARFYHLEPEYIGYMVTGYKYCSQVFYGVMCRMKPEECEPTSCRWICNVAGVNLEPACDRKRISWCLANKPVWKPQAPYE